jgi:type IV pilus assembly protein PilA
MIVVAIVGILSAIAIPNFLRFRMKAKAAEAQVNLAAIRSLETAHLAETNEYLTGQDWTPSHGADHGVRIPWDDNTRFSHLGFAPDSNVYYEYRLEPVGSPFSTAFTAAARSDLDNNNIWSVYFINQAALETQHQGDQH